MGNLTQYEKSGFKSADNEGKMGFSSPLLLFSPIKHSLHI